jgi:hypothetical protein
VADVAAEEDGMRRRFNSSSIYCTSTFIPSGEKERNLSSGPAQLMQESVLQAPYRPLWKPPTIKLTKAI